MKTRLIKLLKEIKNDIIGKCGNYISIANKGHIAIIDEIIKSDNIFDYNDNFKFILKYTNDRPHLHDINKELKQIYESVHTEYLYEKMCDLSDKDKWYHNHYYRYFIDVVMKEIPERKFITYDIKSLYDVFEENPFDDWEYVNSFMVQLSDSVKDLFSREDKNKDDDIVSSLEKLKENNTMLTDCMFTKDFLFSDDNKRYDIVKEAYTRMAEMIAGVYYRGNITDDIKKGCEMLGKMFASNMVFPKPTLDTILENPMYHKDYNI